MTESHDECREGKDRGDGRGERSGVSLVSFAEDVACEQTDLCTMRGGRLHVNVKGS